MTTRNPPWAFDELILALDLYLRRGQLGPRDKEVRDVSDLLNALPIHVDRPDEARFRNPNGVAMKLGNFASIDPSATGVGLRHGGREREQQTWNRFFAHQDELVALVSLLRGAAGGTVTVPSQSEDDEDGVEEGRLAYRKHRVRERNRGLVRRKKDAVLAANGTLACEVCGFDFETRYGALGTGFIECHHVVALSKSGVANTRLQDMVVICSNCHRMIHRRQPWPTPEELRAVVLTSNK